MVRQPVGGDPATIEAGSAALTAAVGPVRDAGTALTRAGSSADGAIGDVTLAAAVTRFAAAWSQLCGDLSVQVTAAATLAQSGSQDLRCAGGERPE